MKVNPNRSLINASGILGLLLATTSSAAAQIIPDNTLPNNTIVAPNGQTINIEGGTRAGGNLFHSFQEFNLDAGTTAFFNNAADIQNILSRVTGGNISNIDGLIKANGGANLFLVNPAGIVFGPNARLNIGGSFLATSADSVIFNNGSFYSATDPNAPPLLTVNVPIGLQLGPNPGPIEVRGVGNPDLETLDSTSLSVTPGRTIALVGGDVTFSGGAAVAPNGRVEVGSVFSGTVSLTPEILGWRLGYEATSPGGEINLLGRSTLFSPTVTDLLPSGGIGVRGGRILLSGRGQIATIAYGSNRGGDIDIDAGESLEIGGTDPTAFPFSSRIVAEVASGAIAPGGNVRIDAPILRIEDGARVETISLGAGDAGDIRVNAELVEVKGVSPTSVATGPVDILALTPEELLYSRIASDNFGAGAGGKVEISTGTLRILDGAVVGTLTSPGATGVGGDVSVNASESLLVSGVNRFNPLIWSAIASNNNGSAAGGNVSVTAREAVLADGGRIIAIATGARRGGRVDVSVTESLLASGFNPFLPDFSSGIASNTWGAGAGGDISVTVGELTIVDGAYVTAQTLTNRELVADRGKGNSGNLAVNARQIEVSGRSVAPDTVSVLGTSTTGSGNAGDVSISTGTLAIASGGTVLSFTISPAGTGRGGNTTVSATEAIAITGIDPILGFPSNLGTATLSSGNAGTTVVNTPRLEVLDGGTLAVNTAATGTAGQMRVNAGEILVGGVAENGSPASIVASAFILDEATREAFFLPDLPTGDTGELFVRSDRIQLRSGGLIGVQHEGTGNAGSLQIDAGSVLLEGGASITAASASGLGGNLSLNLGDSLLLRDGSSITARAGGDGDGGNLTINAETIALLRNSTIDANAFEGSGGNIRITTQGVFPSFDSAITASSQLGVDGTVEVEGLDDRASKGLVEVSNNLPDLAILIANGCEEYANSEFIVTGRGGLPPTPSEAIALSNLWQDWRDSSSLSIANLSPPLQRGVGGDSYLIEATGWVRRPDGGIEVANTRTVLSPPLQRGVGGDSYLIEATGWVRRPDGGIELVANTRTVLSPPLQRGVGGDSYLVEATGWVRRPDGGIELVANTRTVGNSWYRLPECQK